MSDDRLVMAAGQGGPPPWLPASSTPPRTPQPGAAAPAGPGRESALDPGVERLIARLIDARLAAALDLFGCVPADELPLARAALLGDKVARLALADLLEEKGQPERALCVRHWGSAVR